MSGVIDKLKSGCQSPTVLGCDTCSHMIPAPGFRNRPEYWRCGAWGGLHTTVAYLRTCKGEQWELAPPPVPALLRLKRWLIG